MAGSYCKVILIGHLGRDPEIRSFQNGGRVANLSLATSESWRDKASGERKQATQWHRISILNEGLVKIVEQYLKKGSKVLIEGKLETRKWTDNSGQEKYTTEVVIRPYGGELTMLDTRGRGADDEDQDDGAVGEGGTAGTRAYRRNGKDALDEEIPF